MFQAYLITCTANAKTYVGITSRSIRRRWNEHLYDARQRNTKMAISRAIAKYGVDKFAVHALCSARSWSDICAVESILILQYRTRAPNGYNVSDGGNGPFGVKKTPESVERSAAKHRGKPCHPNTIAAAQARRGIAKPVGHGAKVSAALTGIQRSENTKAKLRAYWAARRAAGDFKTTESYAHHRKSAMIAKIPLPLARHIARVYYPRDPADITLQSTV
jgi:group I intron endonuclease